MSCTSNKMSKKLRVAVLLAGELRTYDSPAVAAGLATHLFGLYDCDVYLATWSHRGVSWAGGNAAVAAAGAPDAETLRAFYSYLGASRVVSVAVDNLETWKASLPAPLAARCAEGYEWSGRRYPGSSVPQLFKIAQAFAALRAHRTASSGPYDVVLRARPDALFRAPAIPTPPKPDHVYAINCMYPHRTYWPRRIYDIYFYGDESTLETLVGTYRDHLVNEAHPFDNGLHPKDTCRLLYVQALRNGLNVVDIDYDVCMVYRDN
jgi:hypothetical protein